MVISYIFLTLQQNHWTGGTMLGKAALLEFYKHEFEAYELVGALEDVV